jgi:hypothetical protein
MSFSCWRCAASAKPATGGRADEGAPYAIAHCSDSSAACSPLRNLAEFGVDEADGEEVSGGLGEAILRCVAPHPAAAIAALNVALGRITAFTFSLSAL